MTKTVLAAARARLLVKLAGGKAARVVARAVPTDAIKQMNNPDCAAMVRVSSDVVLEDRMKLSAAAIYNSNDLAASVSGVDRTALAKLIDNDLRTIALSARRLARPATGATGEACGANIKASLPDIEAAWAHVSPFHDAPLEQPADFARLTAATELALSRMEFSDD